jgi:rSAM/selenodomain-associated transferase 2/rSAM/selenodomain-associated transferase 1
MQYSIIIPTINEEDGIAPCIESVRRAIADVEIIVADGGSTDATRSIASRMGARVVESKRSRGIQCNAGARIARGNVLVFLHADTVLPGDAYFQLERYFLNPKSDAAMFRMKFDHPNRWFRLYSWFTHFDSIFTSFGDQCIIVRRTIFEEAGGFPDWVLFEDLEFIRRVRRLKKKIKKLPSYVTTSARRFVENGIVRQQLYNIYFTAQFVFNVPVEDIARQYDGLRRRRMRNALIIFARYPEPGKVKTRLASSIGNERAAALYKQWAEKMVFESKQAKYISHRYLFYADPTDYKRINSWSNDGFLLFAQNGNEFGDRLKEAFRKVFDDKMRKAIIIGTDVPDLSGDIIDDAVRQLDTNDIVIGPASDGGYYLIGMNRFYPELFDGIPWSTGEVLNATINKMQQVGLRYHQMSVLSDIDTIEDLNCWNNKNPVRKAESL